MQLTLQTRFVGNVYIIHCTGRVVLGPEVTALEAALEDGVQHLFNLFVLSLDELTRLDSIGVGLLVRFAERIRQRGGDLRLAAPPAFLTKLLDLTQISKSIHSFPTDEDAILSYLRQPSPENEAARQKTGPRVLFVDESADLCVFVRTILQRQGFNVRFSCFAGDVRVLLMVDSTDYLLVGPGTFQRPAETFLKQLSMLAPKAIPLRLPDDFKTRDAEDAANTLLRLFHLPASA